MKGRIKTGDLRKLRPAFGDGAYGGEIVRLVRARQRRQAIERFDDLLVEDDRFVEMRPTVDDPVAGPDDRQVRRCANGVEQPCEQRFVVAVRRKAGTGEIAGLCAPSAEMRAVADRVDLPADEHFQRVGPIDRELDARRTGVEDEDGGAHLVMATPRWTNNCAIAHEAMRLSGSSARLVRMIGTRAPRTMPAVSAPAR